ncbi:DUF881 domain-containing protein [Oryzihumus leptocrescens]|uniref:Uncharacterized protein YlxW (UPF0749 family) n=1 Tax=Oryzihumus leptocrescens TaxID=297536 RepID=A0A542ZJ34_9MICO|nr:DUF881 domain-containing protein [Oryzihumus leptocrescens]TQL60362.1 uncharacterized protein YlxW (UPF0749 family) [Oryzihumus leptocrescens]
MSGGTSGVPGAGTPPRRVDASMSLINEIMQRPLDPGYAAAADARVRAGLPASTGLRTPTLLVGAILLGALLVTGALSLRVPATAASKAKQQLITEIDSRRHNVDAQTARVARLRAEIDAAQAQSLQLASQGQLLTQLRDTELVTGAAPAVGPGLTLTMDDAPANKNDQGSAVDPRTNATTDQGKVIARDLQIVVNGLWAAGAEAISINGQRLTSRSAIRFAGQAILVDYRPLTRPYVITALGDSSSLPAEFAGTDGGSYLQSLTDNYGIRADLKPGDRLRVPGDSSLNTRLARPQGAGTAPATGGPTSSGTGSSTTSPTTTETAP